MDEFSAVLKARELVRKAEIDSAPVDVEKYLKLPTVNGALRIDSGLPDNQAGSTTVISGKNCIFVNGRHSPQRQRFTALHEIGHIVLSLPSSHSGGLTTKELFSYQSKPLEEIVCDVFAAELLLPEPLFRRDVTSEAIGFSTIERLAVRYDASLTSTGSRFATLNQVPCAFVLAEAGTVRYVSYSLAMRELKCWITTRLPVPDGTLTARVLKGSKEEGPEEVEAYSWLENEKEQGRYLFEDTRLLDQWNQSLTLLWFDDTGGRKETSDFHEDYEEPALRELNGDLPWPSKRKRR